MGPTLTTGGIFDLKIDLWSINSPLDNPRYAQKKAKANVFQTFLNSAIFFCETDKNWRNFLEIDIFIIISR